MIESAPIISFVWKLKTPIIVNPANDFIIEYQNVISAEYHFDWVTLTNCKTP